MPLDALAPTRAILTDRLAVHWRAPLLRLALAWVVVFGLFAPDWATMVMQWWDSSTYNHILLVPVIIGWLVWQRAPELARLAPHGWWPGLGPLAGALLVWLLGDISGLATASQLGVVAMLQACVLLFLGPRVSFGLLFPLAYGLFLVPIGDELVPALQMVTASITIWLTEASGIPAIIDGVFIDTPIGLFEVAEACSGVKFLVAMIALGALVAHVCFTSWVRRMAFMAAAIAIPILANGLRAWGTIFIAQSQGLEFAAGFDHIFYGWIFFGLVMALLLAVGWRFFDRGVDDPAVDVDRIERAQWLKWPSKFHANGWYVLAAFVALALATHAWTDAAKRIEAPMPAGVALPDVAGWSRVSAAHSYPWEPNARGADRRLSATFQDADGRRVDVYLALYAAQEEGREAGAFGEGAQPQDSQWRWLADEAPVAGAMGEHLQALGTHQRLAMTWFRHGDWTGGSRAKLKLLTMRDRLLFQARPTMMLIVSAEERNGHDARDAIVQFHAAIAPDGEWLDRIAGLD